MNQWIFEPEDNTLVYVGETHAIFIKLIKQSGEYLQEIHDCDGKPIVSFAGQIRDLSPLLLSLCTI